MTNKGRHSSEDTAGFYRDLAVMILGIFVIGALVFLLLLWWADDDTDMPPPPVGADTTTTTVVQTTTTSVGETTTTEAATTTTVPVRAPHEVRVAVVNSVGVAGAAGRLTQRLADAGYQTLPADDFAPEQDPSRIWYRDGFSAEASELLEFLPDARVEPLADEDLKEGADIVLVLGTGYSE